MTSLSETLRTDFYEIFSSAIKAVDPYHSVLRHLNVHDETLFVTLQNGRSIALQLNNFERIFVVGAGKATAPMAEAVEKLLGNRISDGIIVVKDGHRGNITRITQMEASHPLPDGRSIKAAELIQNLIKSASEKDLIISLLSGGGSSLLTFPADISLEDKIATTALLLRCGASIEEVNCVRKHLSHVKGGLLAKMAYPATVLNCLISDVVGDDISAIASGPFSPDTSTYGDALQIFHTYGLNDKIPPSVLERLSSGAEGKISETGKPNDPCFAKVHTIVLASNIQALTEARRHAVRLGYHTLILSSMLEGDTSEVALFHGRIAREIHASGNPLPRPACIISGGETTVRVRGNGLGGRNMEFALRCAIDIKGIPNILIASVGTDGTDGPTDAAGAIADGTTVERSLLRGLSAERYLVENDSYRFFDALGDLIKTGPTRTNVMDFRIILAR